MKMLHQEIIVDILTRLPAKSIGRFRCVSKPWKSLLSQPHFIKTHLNRTKHDLREESLILFCDESQSMYSIQLNNKNAHHVFDKITTPATKLCFYDHHNFASTTFARNMASCDGLILVRDEEDKLVLVNPTTREVKELPCSPYALDPGASFTMYGLGHGSWKCADSSPYDHAVGHLAAGVCVDGFIYWLASRNSDYSSVIAAFDLGEEKFREMPPPSLVDREKFVFNHLVALGGCLCMFSSSGTCETDFWVMKQYGVAESWTKITIINPEESELRPMCLLGKEQVVLVKDEETVDEKLVMYNLEEGSFKDIAVHGVSDQFCVGGSFIESLVWPHCKNGDIREC
ncbi:F-box/kelch-repeat protein At3g06240 isoform X2 [Beta vulgaris subsp. vulgaris]|uniref:F-box/kelch-repeat protein At3g06240 isoform X2 n=1 Tax=Beta vulgaris subsp. vulgaris TaxID=3555 RepID=UPI00203699B7|nr:F-box/kelch-repeat protein At3g06240 isoform X2 [Beta vulgaris subsp. vulgaris]